MAGNGAVGDLGRPLADQDVGVDEAALAPAVGRPFNSISSCSTAGPMRVESVPRVNRQ